MTQNTNKLKYEPMKEKTIQQILEIYGNEPIIEYIKELWSLISYQKDTIVQQRIEIIACKHKEAWKRYDKE
jgi:hypothetical protein